MKQTAHLWLALLAAWLLASCSSDSFKIDGKIDGLGTQNVHVVYNGDEGAVDAIMPTHDDELRIKCHSSEMTVVSVIDMRGVLLARFAAQNGDEISIMGKLERLDDIKVSGNDVTDEWMTFREANASLYLSLPNQALDQAIEKYVKANPKHLCSTILLLYDHGDLTSNDSKLKLLQQIAPEARPDHLITSAEWLQEYYTHHMAKAVHSLHLCGTSGDFERLVVDKQRSLLYFWNNDFSAESSRLRRDIIAAIKRMKAGDASVMVADILLDADSTRWASSCRRDSTSWRHYWVPGGVADAALKDFRIPSAPYFLATDSLGRITYRGTDVHAAIRSLH